MLFIVFSLSCMAHVIELHPHITCSTKIKNKNTSHIAHVNIHQWWVKTKTFSKKLYGLRLHFAWFPREQLLRFFPKSIHNDDYSTMVG